MGKAKYPVKVDLSEEVYKKLQEIREHYGLNYDAETIRLCINDAYKIMKQREKILSVVAKDIEDTDK